MLLNSARPPAKIPRRSPGRLLTPPARPLLVPRGTKANPPTGAEKKRQPTLGTNPATTPPPRHRCNGYGASEVGANAGAPSQPRAAHARPQQPGRARDPSLGIDKAFHTMPTGHHVLVGAPALHAALRLFCFGVAGVLGQPTSDTHAAVVVYLRENTYGPLAHLAFLHRHTAALAHQTAHKLGLPPQGGLPHEPSHSRPTPGHSWPSTTASLPSKPTNPLILS